MNGEWLGIQVPDWQMEVRDDRGMKAVKSKVVYKLKEP